jgi:hypothetical protein
MIFLIEGWRDFIREVPLQVGQDVLLTARPITRRNLNSGVYHRRHQ